MMCTDLHSRLASLLAHYDRSQIAVVKDDRVTFETSYPTLSLAVSEEHKSLETVARIWDFLLDRGITRSGVLVCVGGGVLTDMGGFAAATYKRGIDAILVPTTLLAMIDASSGGKTGVNYRGLKNAVGCFAPPVATLVCPDWLATLPPEQLLSGYGEMLKTGLIDNSDRLWERLLQYDLDRMDIAELTPLMESCLRIKEAVVASDPDETGPRKVLNLGHTFGHALEEIQIFNLQSSIFNLQSSIFNHHSLHGYAVLYGLIAELYLSVVKLGCPKEPLQQLTQRMLAYYGRPVCKCSDHKQLIDLMHQDKKNERAAEINCTLLQKVGSPVINQRITDEEADEALSYLFSL